MVAVNWTGKSAFVSEVPSGNNFSMDTHPDLGGENLGPTPLEAFQASLAACSAIDVVSILHKKKQRVTAYRVEVTGERGPEGQFPRPFLSLKLTHIVCGVDLDPAAVARAVELSDQKYCSVSATLRQSPRLTSEWRIESVEVE
jgi:putative redox protein